MYLHGGLIAMILHPIKQEGVNRLQLYPKSGGNIMQPYILSGGNFGLSLLRHPSAATAAETRH